MFEDLFSHVVTQFNVASRKWSHVGHPKTPDKRYKIYSTIYTVFDLIAALCA